MYNRGLGRCNLINKKSNVYNPTSGERETIHFGHTGMSYILPCTYYIIHNG